MDATRLSPIYSTVIASTIFAVLWGIIFKDMLEYEVNRWYANRQTQGRVEYRKPRIMVVYIVLSLLVAVAVGSSLATFGISFRVAGGIAALITLSTALLIWFQLGSMFALLVLGGSEAIDIDSYGAGQKYDSQALKSKEL